MMRKLKIPTLVFACTLTLSASASSLLGGPATAAYELAVRGWSWKCVDCSSGGSASSQATANEAGKSHERLNKGHRWDVKESL